jgi:hypothetical protein
MARFAPIPILIIGFIIPQSSFLGWINSRFSVIIKARKQNQAQQTIGVSRGIHRRLKIKFEKKNHRNSFPHLSLYREKVKQARRAIERGYKSPTKTQSEM